MAMLLKPVWSAIVMTSPEEPCATSGSESPVTRCLLISEILVRIMEEIYGMQREDEEGSHVGKALGLTTLVAMAMSCKLFYEPAMDLVSYELPDILPIIMCLPTDTWSIKEEPEALNVYTLKTVVSLRVYRGLILATDQRPTPL